jgi:hypothetical protein
MAIRHLLWGAALAAAFPVMLAAQPASSPGFHSVSCVKVKPGKHSEFNTLINGDLRKLEQSRVDSGAISAWIELRTVTPGGRDATCDYVFVSFYPGLPSAPMSDEEMTADLQKAGISSSLAEIRQQQEAAGYLVFNSIDRTVLGVGGAKKGDYIVVNDMKVTDEDAWIANEKKLWLPIFEDGVKDGSVNGWSVVVQFMPRGAEDRGITYTVDIYPSWDALFNFFGPKFPDRWKIIHPDVPMNQGMAQEHNIDTIEHTRLYTVVEAIQRSK